MATSTSTTPSLHATSTITVDWVKVGKDRLYAEEEGKYENLPPEGKALLEQLVRIPGCDTNPNGTYCDENKYTIKGSSIVALKNDILLYRVPNEKGGAFFKLYDSKKNTQIGESVYGGGMGIRNNKVIVLGEQDPGIQNGWGLLYYKPGALEFRIIPNSITSIKQGVESYIVKGLGSEARGNIIGDKLIVSIFIFKNEENVKVRDVTFDLTSLP